MSGRTLAWSAPLPSVFSAQMLRACGASAFWRRGIWSGEERGASALLQPVTLGEPLNSSVFSFFNLPSRGKKKNKIYSFYPERPKCEVTGKLFKLEIVISSSGLLLSCCFYYSFFDSFATVLS